MLGDKKLFHIDMTLQRNKLGHETWNKIVWKNENQNLTTCSPFFRKKNRKMAALDTGQRKYGKPKFLE